MSKQEFILLIPAIIYGVAIVDLLKIFRRGIYWEIVGWGVYLLTAAIILMLGLFNQLDYLVDSNINLLLIVLQSILFAKAVELLTPEEKDKDFQAYYTHVARYFILMIVLVFTLSWAAEYFIYDDRDKYEFIRPLSLLLGFIAVFWQNKWYRRYLLIQMTALNFFILINVL